MKLGLTSSSGISLRDTKVRPHTIMLERHPTEARQQRNNFVNETSPSYKSHQRNFALENQKLKKTMETMKT